MSKTATRDLFDRMEGPPKRTYQLFEQGDSVAIVIDPNALDMAGVDFDDLPEVDEWIFEDEDKIVIDLDP